MNIQSINNASAAGVATPRPPVPDSAATVREPALASTSAAAQPPVKVSSQQLDQAVKAVSDFVNASNNSLEFSVDKETGLDVVKVVDGITKELIRQIPSEEMVAIAKALDNLQGLLIQQKA